MCRIWFGVFITVLLVCWCVSLCSRARLKSSTGRRPALAAPPRTAPWSPSPATSPPSPRVDSSTAATLWVSSSRLCVLGEERFQQDPVTNRPRLCNWRSEQRDYRQIFVTDEPCVKEEENSTLNYRRRSINQSVVQNDKERKLRAEWKTDREKRAADKVSILWERGWSWVTDALDWNPETSVSSDLASREPKWQRLTRCGAKVSTECFNTEPLVRFLVSSASFDVTAGDAQSGVSLSGPRRWRQGRTAPAPHPPRTHCWWLPLDYFDLVSCPFSPAMPVCVFACSTFTIYLVLSSD